MKICLLAFGLMSRVVAADCDSQWKANVRSAAGTRQWQVSTKIATLPVELKVTEANELKTPTTLQLSSATTVVRSMLPFPPQQSKSVITKKTFCELLEGETNLPFDLGSLGVLMAQLSRQKPLRKEKISVPAGNFTANVYEKNVPKQEMAGDVHLVIWMAKIGDRSLGVKFKAHASQGVAAGDTTGNLVAYKFR